MTTSVTGAPAVEKLQTQLAGIVGADHVSQEQVEINGIVPAVCVNPGSAEEIAAVLRIANEQRLVVAPAGGFTKQDIGGVPERVDILLRTTRLNIVEHYDPGDLTISLNAGIPFAEAQRRLSEHRQWLPLDAPRLEHATIGGLMATSSAGPLKHTFGGLRDFCIGVQFVTADGKLGKGGGNVVKNVAGFDLMKLMIGSYGSLAIITAANFKIYPRPRQTRTFACSFPSLAAALDFRTRIFKSPLTPLCLEIVSPQAPEYLRDAQPPNNPDHYAPAQPVAAPSKDWQIVLRATGSDTVLSRYARELGSAVTRSFDAAEEEQLWSWISNFEYSVLSRHRNAMIVYTHLAIQNVGPAIQALERAATDYNFIPALVGRAATGNLVLAFIPLSVDPPSAMQYANCVSAFRALLPPGSSAEVAHCPREAKLHFSVWGNTPSDIELMRGVKRALDPENILNRGRFIV